MNNRLNIEAVFTPIFKLWRVFLILPYYRISGRNEYFRIKTTVFSQAFGVFLIGLAIFVHEAVEVYAIWNNQQKFAFNFHTVLEILGFIIACYALSLSTSNCKYLQSVIRTISQVDGSLNKIPGNPQRGLAHVIVGSAVWTSRAVATIWLFGLPYRDIILFPLWFVILATEQMAVVLCSELAIRFHALNSMFNAMKSTIAVPRVSEKVEELRADTLVESKIAWLDPSAEQDPDISPVKIETLREAHSKLADSFQELNKRMGVFMLLDLAYLFIVLLSTSISFLQNCIIRTQNSYRGEDNVCSGYALLALDGLARLTVITISLGGVGDEAERTAEAAARLLRRAIDWDTLRELQIVGAQIRARRVAFWACGLFTVDRPLLFSICGAVTSYLFILSQLK